MSMFPGANAQIYRNEAGEVLGWDYPSDPEPDDHYPEPSGFQMDCDDAYYEGQYAAENDEPLNPDRYENKTLRACYVQGYEENKADG